MTKISAIDDIDRISIASLTVQDFDTQNQAEMTTINNNNIEARPSPIEFIRQQLECSNGVKSLQSSKVGTFERNLKIENNELSLAISATNQISVAHETDENIQKRVQTFLDLEKIKHEVKAGKRHDIFKSIIRNESTNFSLMNLVSITIGIIILGYSTSIPFSLIPASDLIKLPENWKEILFYGSFLVIVLNVWWCFQLGSYLNIEYLKSTRFVTYNCIVVVVTFLIIVISTYYLWTQIFLYQYPIPFHGLIINLSFSSLFFGLIAWIYLPLDWRRDNKLRKSFCFYLLHGLISIIMILVGKAISAIVKKCQDPYQPIAALMFLVLMDLYIIRIGMDWKLEINTKTDLYEWISLKVIQKSGNGDIPGGTIILKHTIAIRHTISLCYIIGNVATDMTSWVLVTIDFAFNLYLCLRIVWINKRYPSKMEKQIHLLQDLVIYELVEFQAPLAFMLVVGITYYGPNGALFGNILNDYWTYSAIKDINATMMNMGFFFIVDFASTITCAIILWLFAKSTFGKLF